MLRLFRKRSDKAGLPPGTMVHMGEQRIETPRITMIDYDENHVLERQVEAPEDCLPFRDAATVTWINVHGLHQPEIIHQLGSYFGLHPLVMEDIVTTDQRPKMEDHDDYIFVVLKTLYHDQKDDEMKAHQVALVVGSNFVMSFQEAEGHVFDAVLNRIKNGVTRVRAAGADYLAYSLMDVVVDNYFALLERLAQRLDVLEDRSVMEPDPETAQAIHSFRRDLVFLRRSVLPLREAVSRLERSESKLIQQPTAVYFRDVYDHIVQVIDGLDALRDMVSPLLEVYVSSVSNKMNEVMKLLTVIGTIFLPLTFLAGVYGMNFRYFPELNWRWGYFFFWGLNLGVVVVMLAYFRKKRWF